MSHTITKKVRHHKSSVYLFYNFLFSTLDFDPAYSSYELSEEDYLHFKNLPSQSPHPLSRSEKSIPARSRRKELNKLPTAPQKKVISEPLPLPSDAFPIPAEHKEEIKRKNGKLLPHNNLNMNPRQSLTIRKKSDEDSEAAEKKMNALLNPKPPLDLPIVKPEVQKLENEPAAKFIPTKVKPFHFHIPIVSTKPEQKLSLGGA